MGGGKKKASKKENKKKKAELKPPQGKADISKVIITSLVKLSHKVCSNFLFP